MILPSYTKVEPRSCLGPELVGKWYCSYHEIRDGERFARYLHPDGWKRICHYWDSTEEMERTFNRVGQQSLEVSDTEFTRETDFRRQWREDYYRDALNNLDREMTEQEIFED